MSVRSKRLFGPISVGNGVSVLYTCPAGRTAVLKSLTLVNGFNVVNSLAIALGAQASANFLWEGNVDPSASTVLNELFIVLQPGDVLRAQATSSFVVITGFGAELLGVAT